MKRFMALFLLSALASLNAEQTPGSISLSYTSTGAYHLVERLNASMYVNGAYVGLTHRETRASLTSTGKTKDGLRYLGHFFVLEETTRDMTKAAQGLDAMVAAEFFVSPTGSMRFVNDGGFPQLRSFPAFPDEPVKVGDRWQAEGYRSVDPKNDGKRTILPILVEYAFVGQERYRDQDVFRIRAKYGTRLNAYRKSKADDPRLVNASGTHDVDILVRADDGAVILILDRLDETFFYADGGSIRFKGSSATFTETPIAIARATLMPEIEAIAKGTEAERDSSEAEPTGSAPDTSTAGIGTETPSNGDSGASTEVPNEAFTVEETPQGIRLSVRDLRFVADSDAILPGEKWRLEAIAQALSRVKDSKFLVEGHTASVGKPAGEMELSVSRAKRIVEEMTKRGFAPEQFIYAGYGGTRPAADNATDGGRALNRRVEITILE